MVDPYAAAIEEEEGGPIGRARMEVARLEAELREARLMLTTAQMEAAHQRREVEVLKKENSDIRNMLCQVVTQAMLWGRA